MADGRRDIVKANVEDAHIHVFTHFPHLAIQTASLIAPPVNILIFLQKGLVFLYQTRKLPKPILQYPTVSKGHQQFVAERYSECISTHRKDHTHWIRRRFQLITVHVNSLTISLSLLFTQL